MNIVSIIFWIAVGLWFIGWTFEYQEIVIGVCALIIGIEQLIGLLRRE